MSRRLEVLLLVGLLLIGGCDEPEKQVLEKRLPYVLPDGSYGSIFLEHKPNTMMLENQQKINLTYYTVKHYPEGQLLGNPFYEGMTLPQMLERGVIDIQFYDKNGNALVAPLNAGFRPNQYDCYEENLIKLEDGWVLQWKGVLLENLLTFENFCDIDSVKVTKFVKE